MFLALSVGNLTEPLTGRVWRSHDVQRELMHRVAWLRSVGLSRGDRVFVHYGNTLEFFVDLLAVWNLGGCVIPIDPRLTPSQVENLARSAAPRFSLWPGTPDVSNRANLSTAGVRSLESPVPRAIHAGAPRVSLAPDLVALDDPALILFTSGTTGEPKGVVHTHRSLRARWVSLYQCLGIRTFRRTLCLLPTHFGHGLICNSLFPWLAGQDLFVVPPFRPEVLMRLGALLDEHEITFMSSVPSMWRLALKTARPPQRGRLERVFCGSAPLSGFLWKGVREWTGTTQVFNAYGITETGSWVAGTSVADFVPEDGLIGLPWGAVIRVLEASDTGQPPAMLRECDPGETGHVWVNTPALMRGYLDRDDLTRKAVAQGWFSTGDIGLVDDRGLLYLRGRERDEINKGGMKVYPSDIDAVAERHEAVADVCAFPYEDALLGENVGLAVVLRNERADTIRTLWGLLGTHLAPFQMPQRVYVLPEIRRTSRGKVNRAEVARECAAREPIALDSGARAMP